MGKEIKIKNTLECKMIIREGNGGVYRQLAVVASGKHYSLKIDPNATYREYVLITLEPENIELPPFSSDDITEFKEIVVKERKEPDPKSTDPKSTVQKYYWEGDPIDGDKEPEKDAKKQETATDRASSSNHGDGLQPETVPATHRNEDDGLQLKTDSATCEKPGFWHGLVQKGLSLFRKSSA